MGTARQLRPAVTTSWSVADHFRPGKAGERRPQGLTESACWTVGHITESVKPETGQPDQAGRAFATAAGYVAHVICAQFCTDRKPVRPEAPGGLPGRRSNVHRSRINGILIDCNVENIQEAARFWAEALGRPVDPGHPGTRGDYVMLETPPDGISVQIQRVEHESRVISTSKRTTSPPKWHG